MYLFFFIYICTYKNINWLNKYNIKLNKKIRNKDYVTKIEEIHLKWVFVSFLKIKRKITNRLHLLLMILNTNIKLKKCYVKNKHVE